MHGRIEAQIKLMDGGQPGHGVDLERDRQAQRRLEPRAPTRRSSTQGFLLNHLISRAAAGAAAATATPTADPVTGQAAWYDLRVRVEKAAAAEDGFSAPQFATLRRPPSMLPPPDILRYGAGSGDDAQRRAAE